MFEPQAFSIRSSGQDELMDALQRRDMEAFERALADPEVDPNYWYGKPYWSTCLQIAAKTEGCEPFVLALLRAGAGDSTGQRPPLPPGINGLRSTSPRMSERTAKYFAGGHGDDDGAEDEFFELGPLSAPAGTCVCGAQGVFESPGSTTAAEILENVTRAAETTTTTTTTTPPPPTTTTTPPPTPPCRESSASTVPGTHQRASSGCSKSAYPDRLNDTLSFWLRDLCRAVRESADLTRRELRGLSERVAQLSERVAAMEHAQALALANGIPTR